MTADTLANWIHENKVLDIILGGKSHIEIVKRCGPILRFMAMQQGKFDAQTVSLVWKCQTGKHEEMVRTVYNLIQEIMPFLSVELCDQFFSKIEEMPPQQYDEKFLVFLSEYTKMALNKRFKLAKQQWTQEKSKARHENVNELEFEQEDEDGYDQELSQHEKNVLAQLQQANLSTFADAPQVNNLYGLPIFWAIAQDANQANQVQERAELMRNLAMKSMLELFDQDFRKNIRLTYLLKSIKNLQQRSSVVQSLQVATAIIKSFYIDHMQENQQYARWGEEQKTTPVHLIAFLQERLALVDLVIANVEHYHGQVQLRLKSLLEKNKVPENVEEFTFSGSYTHNKTLDTLLEFIEYLIIQSQNDSQQHDDFVSLGIDNIYKLWQLFVSKPNFNSDQGLFLGWINKQRVQQVRGQSAHTYANQLVTQEVHIFTEQEKKYLFSSILCHPEDVQNMPLNLVKVFHRYFKQINKSEQNLNHLKKKIKVLRFDQLLGKDTLWNIALHACNEKVKEIAHELLVDLHLKFDYANVTEEHVAQVLMCFVDRCMQELEDVTASGKKAAIQLISLFLDRYEGIRPILPENAIAQRLSNVKPQTITIINCMDMENKLQKQIQVSYFQTLGYVRSQIAQIFGLQINEFNMIIRSNQIDADTEDDTYIKDIQGLFQQVTIKQNKHYNRNLHPKYLLSNNEKHFKTIFSMLKSSDASLTELVWALISKLPQNQSIFEQFQSLKLIRAAQDNPQELQQAWSQLLDEKAVFNLLYCLKIINSTYLTQLLPKSSVNDENLQEAKAWKNDFVRLGGFTHLLRVLAHLNLDQIECALELVCIKTLVETIFRIMLSQPKQNDAEKKILELQDPFLLRQIVLKVLRYVQLICQFSIKEEQKRGESVESIEKRIQDVKVKKHRYKLMIKGNKADNNTKKQDDDDNEDGSNEDKKLLQSINVNFHSQIDILQYLFNFMNQIFSKNPDSLSAIAEFTHLEELFTSGMLLSENANMRRFICSKFAEIIRVASTRVELSPAHAQLPHAILNLELDRLLPMTQNHESRSNVFYEVLQELIFTMPVEVLSPLKSQVEVLIGQLTEQIINRATKEQTTADRDIFLQGQMLVLTRLLQKFPEHKEQVGSHLTMYLIHQCLFEIPQGNHGANSTPKCKSQESRRAAFNLLATLSRDCLENLNMVLKYMHKFSSEVSWRTKKDTDWNIKFYDDEKSSTGHVGIKNLGCICYMNSLNQQLFMIPGFRNDILSIKDPNHDKNPDEDNMFLQWQNLFAGLLLSEKMYVNPKAYCHSFKDWEGQPVNIVEQMDVEEYLNMFMDRLETAIKGTPQEKTIQYHFGGSFANEIICKTCPHSYLRTESFLNVGIPVMNKKSLYEGLDAFVKGDMLEERDQYLCEKCDKKVDALKRTCFQALPRYMIMTLKRFEFDMDIMERVKLNDYYEFKEEIDIAEYTHEYLSAKEKAQKAQKNEDGEAANSKEELLKTLKQPRAYYQYELVGVVVHSGTANSGHYYSYIKEQEAFKAQDSDKWFEFNDTWVRDFDHSEIPAECYGGEETAYSQSQWGNQQQKYMKFRNAYLLVYKRKLTDDSLLVKDEAEAEADPKPKYQLGSQDLQIDVTSPLFKKIAADNHKYWQNRFLFGTEYFEFVQQIILYWNTNRVIPHEVSWRNNDYHLLDQTFKTQHDLSKLPIQAAPINDVKIDLKTKYSAADITNTKLQVFKFATQFYVSILQRSFDKNTLPDTVKYIRAYINDDETCARWLISEFVNFEVLVESFLDSSMPFMRKILAGLLYCAMLKVWETDRRKINLYWDDLAAGVEEPRSTILGSFMLCLITKLPMLLDYSNNHQQWLQMIARFSNLGPEARLFLLHAGTIEKCMNLFHINDTPYRKEFLQAQCPPFELKSQLDIGLPTQEDPNQKMSMFSMLKEKNRQKKLHSDTPKYHYLIETVANCLRALHVETPSKVKDPNHSTPLQLEDSGFVLTDHETTLIMPQAEFIEKFVSAATKPRSFSALAKGYIHWCYHNPQSLNKMWDTVQLGLKKYDYGKMRPFLVLFQHMLEARESQAVKQLIGQWLEELFSNVIRQQTNYYQWMETMIDFVIKIGTRIPEVKAWLVANQQQWSYLLEWLKQNPEPPVTQQYYGQYNQQQSQCKLNKNKYAKQRNLRYDKLANQAALFLRRTYLIHLKDPNHVLDLSHEVDLDQLDLTDYKYMREMMLDYINGDLNPMALEPCVVTTEMEELLSIKFVNTDKTMWEAQEKNKFYPAGIIGSTHLNKEYKKVFEAIQAKQQQERLKQQQQSQHQQQRAQPNQQDQNWEGQHDENGSPDDRQDADMDFEGQGEYGGYYNALDPQSHATGGYSHNYDSNEDEDNNE